MHRAGNFRDLKIMMQGLNFSFCSFCWRYIAFGCFLHSLLEERLQSHIVYIIILLPYNTYYSMFKVLMIITWGVIVNQCEVKHNSTAATRVDVTSWFFFSFHTTVNPITSQLDQHKHCCIIEPIISFNEAATQETFILHKWCLAVC